MDHNKRIEEGTEKYMNSDEEENEENELGCKSEEKYNLFFEKNRNTFEDEGILGKVGSLSEELANIGHIDSSETSEDSPEGKLRSKQNV